MQVETAETDAQIDACFPVMRALRPHLEADAFVRIVREMQAEGYVLAFLSDAGEVVAVAGFRTKRTLFCDKFLYVDDLVTRPGDRSKGYGKRLLEWLEARARAEGCAKLDLDSAMHRKDAHRFYERNAVSVSGYHFSIELEKRIPWAGSVHVGQS